MGLRHFNCKQLIKENISILFFLSAIFKWSFLSQPRKEVKKAKKWYPSMAALGTACLLGIGLIGGIHYELGRVDFFTCHSYGPKPDSSMCTAMS